MSAFPHHRQPAERPAATALVFVLALAAGALALPASAAEPAQRIDITGAAASPVAPAKGVEQRYAMDDGRPMHVVSYGDMLAIRYGARPERYLHRDPQGRFVSGNGRWTLQFDRDDRGSPSIAHLTRPVSR